MYTGSELLRNKKKLATNQDLSFLTCSLRNLDESSPL